MNEIENQVRDYYRTLDESLSVLSHRVEGEISKLPRWARSNRQITIAVTNDSDGVAIKVTPRDDLQSDQIQITTVNSHAEVNDFIGPHLHTSRPLQYFKDDDFILASDVMVFGDNPLLPPALHDTRSIGYGRRRGFNNLFNTEAAKSDAIGLWNEPRVSDGRRLQVSYVTEVRNILETFGSIIRRKSFMERKVHRYLDKHRAVLLPPFKRCFFEHDLFSGSERRTADFILQKEDGRPALLIELENPVHKVFTKAMELTKDVNHAKGQIAEWVQWIDVDPNRNASGDFAFLAGPKERLVVIGRGLEHLPRLINTKYSDTLIWTYDVLLEEARFRLNDGYVAQCEMVGLKSSRPF